MELSTSVHEGSPRPNRLQEACRPTQTQRIVRSVTPVNRTMFQGFEWYVAADGTHFRRLARDLPALKDIGITALWIPPACKASGVKDNGFGIYGLLSFRILLT